MSPRFEGYVLRLFFTLVCVITLVAGCAKSEPITYKLDTTPILSGGLGWAVISGAYVRLKTEPGFEARDGDYARRGDILRVVATERAFTGRNRGTWYKLEGNDAGGWLHQSLMVVYPSLERAHNAARNSMQGTTGQAQ
jgi:hypothetical protein